MLFVIDADPKKRLATNNFYINQPSREFKFYKRGFFSSEDIRNRRKKSAQKELNYQATLF